MDILVINTDLMDRSVIQQVLERSDHKVTFVGNTEAAWKLMADGRFRFVIADTTALEQKVKQLISQTREQSGLVGQVYFLLLSKKGQNEYLLASMGAGADDYMNTPVTPHELKMRVSVGARILFMGDTLSNARNQLENLALFDSLTGLMNRQAFYKIAQGELERARREANGISVIVMGVNNFESITKTHGDSTGNDVLLIVAQVIREKSRPYDCIGRLDGDQFAITLPGIVSSNAEKIAQRILKGVQTSQIELLDGTALEVNLNIGIASTQNINAYAEVDFFIQNAIQAMTASKQNDKEKVSVAIV